jgi:hypothetical protein
MKLIAFCVMALSWLSLLVWRGDGARVIQAFVFGTVGTVLALAGGFAYWWDSSMRPSQASSFIFICGALAVLPHLLFVVRAVLENEGGMEWPRKHPKRPKSPPRR